MKSMTKSLKTSITRLSITSLAASILMASSSVAMAQTIAITNATLHTATEQGTLQNATVIIKDGVISAINPSAVDAQKIIDAKGQDLTPGFIAPMTAIGLVEVGAVSQSRDNSDDKADITFDPSLAFNPDSTVIPYTRKGGITSTVITPANAKSIFRGLNSHMDLSGELEHSEIETGIGAFVSLGSASKGSRALKMQKLIKELDERVQKVAAAKSKKGDKKDAKPPSEKDKILDALLAGEKVLTVYANRASDLLQLIKVKQKFNLNVVLLGGSDAPKVAKQLAAANISVIMSPIANLPRSFDGRHASLNDAKTLIDAGVNVLFIEREVHNIYQLRFLAGIAIANGVKREDALKALSANVAKAYGLDAGTIAVGKRADLVLWQGDMFDVSGAVDKIWIEGKAYTTESRHDKLRERYRNKTQKAMPPAYTK